MSDYAKKIAALIGGFLILSSLCVAVVVKKLNTDPLSTLDKRVAKVEDLYGYKNLEVANKIREFLFTHATGTDIDVVNAYVDNLYAGTAVITAVTAGSIIPTTNNTYDVGSPAKSWSNIYASGTLMVGNGSESAPSIAAGSDTNTGIYFNGSDSLRFTTGGTTKLIIGSGGSFLPGTTTNSYDFGSATYSWKDIYASGTYYGVTAQFSSSTNAILAGDGTAKNPAFSFISDPDTGIYRSSANSLSFSANGTYTASFSEGTTNLFSTNVRMYGTTFYPATNNQTSLGFPSLSWKDIYASGTYYGVDSVLTGSQTVYGTSTVGDLFAQQDAGSNTLYDMQVANATIGSQQSLSLAIDGNNAFKAYSVSNGAGSIASSTLRILWPMSFPVTGTSTMATSTSLRFDQLATTKARYMVMGSNIGNTTATTPFPPTTEEGLVVYVLGASDTQKWTICDNDVVGGTNVQLPDNACDEYGAGDSGAYIYSHWLGYWTRFTNFFPI